jgi:hypothetical protein
VIFRLEIIKLSYIECHGDHPSRLGSSSVGEKNMKFLSFIS